MVRQRFGYRFGAIFLVVIVGRQCSKCALVRERRSISVMPSSWGSRVEAALKRLLYHCPECDPCLRRGLEAIPFLECPNIQPRHEQEANRILQQLPISVRVATKNGDFRTILDAPEQDLGSICRRINAAKGSVVQLHCCRCRLAINAR